MKNKSLKFSILLASACTFYETTAYAFLVPVIAHLFFLEPTPILAMVKGYCAIGVSLFARPIGIIYFSRCTKKYGVTITLYKSVLGLICAALLMATLPSYTSYGIMAPIVLILCRTMRSFFAAGETNTGKIHLMQNHNLSKNIFAASQYDIAAITGILIASAVAYLCYLFPNAWRLAFVLPILGFIVSAIIRRSKIVHEKIEPLDKHHAIKAFLLGLFSTMRKNKKRLLQMSTLHGFSHFAFYFAFVFLNTFLPEISKDVTQNKMLLLNIPLLVIDLFVLIACLRYRETLVKMENILILLPAMLGALIPCAFLFKNNFYLSVNLLRVITVIIGAICPVYFSPLTFSTAHKIAKNEYALYGIAQSFGSEILGRSLPAIGLFCLYLTSSYWTTVTICSVICFASTICAFSLKKFVSKL